MNDLLFSDRKTLFDIKDPRYANCTIKNCANPSNLSLLSKNCEFPILKIIPRNFTIATNTNKCKFNIYLLKRVSPKIQQFILRKCNSSGISLDFNDDENILPKIERLFLGESVAFEIYEIEPLKQLIENLRFDCFPDFLTPSRKTYYSYYHIPSSFKDPSKKIVIEIQKDVLSSIFTQSSELPKLTIKTNKYEYKCLLYGAYSSNVIRKHMETDPTINEFSFDFDDENDEFMQIIKIFNFQKVEMKNSNIKIIKELAEQLEIKCILSQIDDFITKNTSISKIIDEKSKSIESIDNLFDLLINIKKHGVLNVAVSIIQSKIPEKKEKVQELAAFILQVVKPNVLIHKEIAELLIQLNKGSNDNNHLGILIPYLVQILMTYYMPYKIEEKPEQQNGFYHSTSTNENENYFDNIESKFIFSFIRILYKRGLIKNEELKEKLQIYNYNNKNFNAFFLPEIIEFNPSSVEILKNKYYRSNNNSSYYSSDTKNGDVEFKKLIDKYLPDKIDLYTEMLDKMEPEDELTQSIRNDDVDLLKSIITKNNIDINKQDVPYNIFDDLFRNPTILNYSALCGSIKCFKYILLNGGLIDKSSFYFAIRGNNIEIIKIVDQKLTEYENSKQKSSSSGAYYRDQYRDSSYYLIEDKKVYYLDYTDPNTQILSAIEMHRNELFDWLFEKKFLNKTRKKMKVLALISAASGNVHSLIKICDNGYNDISSIIFQSAKNGFFRLSKLFLDFYNPTELIEYPNYIKTDLLIQFRNLSIFKLLVRYLSNRNLEDVVLQALKNFDKPSVYYYFDNYNKLGITPTDYFLKNALELSFKWKTQECFIFLFERIKITNPTLFTLQFYIDLLNNSCLSANFETTKIISNIIIKEDKTSDFSEAFRNACKSECIEICYYFINENFYINYNKLLQDSYDLGTIDSEIFSIIINKSDPRIRFRYYRCIPLAIKKKNKELLEHIFKEKEPNENELFSAVSSKDISIVDLVLKYNSKPSFINHKTKDGTAIYLAYKDGSIDIFKHLLSIPGINPTLVNCANVNCLDLALDNYDCEIVDLILNNLGDNIQSQVSVILSALVKIGSNFYTPSQNEYQRQQMSYFPYKNEEKCKASPETLWELAIRLLKVKYIDPNISLEDGMTFLHIACNLNKIDIVKSLLQIDKIDVNTYETKSYNTPLMTSIIKCNTEIAKILIDYPKTDLNMKDIKDNSVLQILIQLIDSSKESVDKLTEIVELLINNERFDPIESNLDRSFFESTNIAVYKILASSKYLDVNFVLDLSNHDNILYRNFDFEVSTLLDSVGRGVKEKVDLIINHSSFDKDKSDIKNAIFLAAENNIFSIFLKLIKLIDDDDDVNIKNYNNQNLLSASMLTLSGPIVDYIFNNPKFDYKNLQFDSLLAELLYYHSYNSKTNKYIIFGYYDLNNANPLHKKNTILEMVNKIFDFCKEHDRHIDLNKLLPNGKSFFTIIGKDFDQIELIINFLIQNGADPNLPDKNNLFPLEHAIKINSYNFIEALINTKKINFQQLPNGNSYLHIAASFSNKTTFESILKLNLFDINCTNDQGNTPLIEASKLYRFEIVQLLFEQDNLDYLHCNKDGKDALSIVTKFSDKKEQMIKQNKQTYGKELFSHCRRNSNSSYGNDPKIEVDPNQPISFLYK